MRRRMATYPTVTEWSDEQPAPTGWGLLRSLFYDDELILEWLIDEAPKDQAVKYAQRVLVAWLYEECCERALQTIAFLIAFDSHYLHVLEFSSCLARTVLTPDGVDLVMAQDLRPQFASQMRSLFFRSKNKAPSPTELIFRVEQLWRDLDNAKPPPQEGFLDPELRDWLTRSRLGQYASPLEFQKAYVTLQTREEPALEPEPKAESKLVRLVWGMQFVGDAIEANDRDTAAGYVLAAVFQMTVEGMRGKIADARKEAQGIPLAVFHDHRRWLALDPALGPPRSRNHIEVVRTLSKLRVIREENILAEEILLILSV